MSSKLWVKLLSVIILSNSSLDQQWSMMHGFFIVMGGFHLFKDGSEESDSQRKSQEDDDPLHPLLANDLTRDDISFTMPTLAEIEDRGKSDWLAKSLVLLQTSWFVVQCIARAIEHLPVTHLEIVTVAYAVMNLVIYAFWWDKPLNVGRPVRVFRKSDSRATDNGIEVHGAGKSEPRATDNGIEAPDVKESEPRVADNGIEVHGSGESEPKATQPPAKEPISGVRESAWNAIANRSVKMIKIIASARDESVDLSRKDRVPRFWADSGRQDVNTADGIVLTVGVCFGAIHCIAWFFSIPTHVEMLMWQISCVTMTVFPFCMVVVWFLALSVGIVDFDVAAGSVGIYILILSTFLLYLLARAATLVLAFTSLRGLPAGAYETVHWTTFIPHI